MKNSTLREPLVLGKKSNREVTDEILSHMEGKPGKLWWLGLSISGTMALIGLYAMWITAIDGIGTWGLDKTVGWGLDITNFVWWVGIGHAGTFISAILLLFRQRLH